MSLNILGIIPARYGSTRFPGKPLVPIAGKTLLQRTYENARQASVLDALIIATDDRRIFNHVQEFGGQAVMTSSDCLTGTDRLAEVLELYPEWQQASIIVNIQGDEPYLDRKAIHQVVHLLLSDEQAVMSTVVTPLILQEDALNPSVVKCVMDQNQNALYFSRHLIPANKQMVYLDNYPYFQHLGLYAYRPSFLLIYRKLTPTPLQLTEDLEQLKVLEHGYRIKVACVDQKSPGVDTPEDVNKIEQWLCKQNMCLLQEASAPPLGRD
jgi:3-deoxy-manno-octulosonate cytidylyltransferase (CMP-KDO synthetase)